MFHLWLSNRLGFGLADFRPPCGELSAVVRKNPGVTVPCRRNSSTSTSAKCSSISASSGCAGRWARRPGSIRDDPRGPLWRGAAGVRLRMRPGLQPPVLRPVLPTDRQPARLRRPAGGRQRHLLAESLARARGRPACRGGASPGHPLEHQPGPLGLLPRPLPAADGEFLGLRPQFSHRGRASPTRRSSAPRGVGRLPAAADLLRGRYCRARGRARSARLRRRAVRLDAGTGR